jgi:hypothetical protein
MVLNCCLIGNTSSTNNWEIELEEFGGFITFSNMEEALEFETNENFALTFINTECLNSENIQSIFELRKKSHSKIVLLGSLNGFERNFLYEYVIFDWCEHELSSFSIDMKLNWYRGQITGPLNTIDESLIDSSKIQLTRKEETILNCLYRQKVISANELQRVLWKGVSVTSHVLDVHLSNLRKKIKPYNKTIKKERNGNVYLKELEVS